MKEIDLNITILILETLGGLTNLFCFCYFGKISSESFEHIADCLYDANWYEMPYELQKNFIMMIRNAEIPLYYHGLNLVILNLETYFEVRIFCINNSMNSVRELKIFFIFFSFLK